ncbi:MAG: TraR/DksA C4-type zinc finger protein [Acidimicrobiia bacterium]|nr:TraR/DksA C4-type zinc finger protein [Acidimicrobiia bacterium]
MTIDLDSARSGLVAEREKLVRQMHELGATESGDLRSDHDFGEGFADAAAITAERTEVLGLVETLKSRLEDVDAAIAQIDSGTYGICETCGTEIPAARLEARPEAVLCVDCKSKRR